MLLSLSRRVVWMHCRVLRGQPFVSCRHERSWAAVLVELQYDLDIIRSSDGSTWT